MNQSALIQILKKTGALLEGHFLLTSGRHSGVYIEKFRLLESPKYLDKICREMAIQFSSDKVDVVFGAAIGGILLSGGVGRYLKRTHIFSERINGKMELRRGFSIRPDKHILIVEDIITTGSSIFEMIELVERLNGKIIGVTCIVDRSKNGIEFGVSKNTLLSLPSDDWDPDQCPLCKNNIPITTQGRTGK